VNCKLHRAASDAIVKHALAARPRECCGILVGKGDEIVEAVVARNLAGGQNRFFIDPADHVAARRAARQRDLDVLGFYHSHPRSAALPSERDLAEATYSGHLYLIVSLEHETADIRVFRLEDRNFLEMTLVTVS